MVVFIILAMASLTSAVDARLMYAKSAASDAQIKFAIENNYDATGPGAKSQEYAHKTMRNLEEALISYLQDPDTKLPESEKFKAYHQLVIMAVPQGKKPTTPTPFLNYSVDTSAAQPWFFREPGFGFGAQRTSYNKIYSKLRVPDTIRIKKLPLRKEKPISLGHYKKESSLHNGNPHYSFSYGVHDQYTGDSKSAQETRQGDAVQGYYMLLDPDGKKRTVHYTADDSRGFQARVQRIAVNN